MTEPPAPARPAPRRKKGGSRAERADRKRALAEAVEKAAEFRAPAAQRHAVAAADGNLIRGPRVEQDGPAFVRSNPIRHLVKRNRHKSDDGERPMFTIAHQVAAEQLQQAWQEGADGISPAIASYGDRGSSGSPQTGYISPAALAAINRQIAARQQCERAHAYLGPSLWQPILFVVIRAIDVSAWADKAEMRREVATGYLAAALDRLVEFYKKGGKSTIRSAAVAAKPPVVQNIPPHTTA